MTRSLRFGTLVLGAMFAFGALAVPAEAAGLTSAQISAILGLLQAFGASPTVIANVQKSLQNAMVTTPATTPTSSTTTPSNQTTATSTPTSTTSTTATSTNASSTGTAPVASTDPNVRTITSTSPNPVPRGSVLTVYGTNFDAGSYLNVDGTTNGVYLAPLSYTSTSLTFTIPMSLAVTGHPIQIYEKSNGRTSNTVNISVSAEQ